MTDEETAASVDEFTLPKRVLAWAVTIAMGPLLLGGEWVDPAGYVHWRVIIPAVLGTLLWVRVGMWVVTHV